MLDIYIICTTTVWMALYSTSTRAIQNSSLKSEHQLIVAILPALFTFSYGSDYIYIIIGSRPTKIYTI